MSAGDAAGNWSAQGAVLTVSTADATPPSAPSGLAYTSVECGSAIFGWGASTDNIAVTGYKLFRTSSSGTQTIDVGLATAYMDNGITPSTSYTYVVKAYDKAGNVSLGSNSVSFSTLSDSDSTSDYEVDYVDDDHGDLSRINRADGSAVATFTYNVDGSRKTRWLANNTQTDCAYDDSGRMTSIRNYSVPETTNIELQIYGYDIMDRRTYTKRTGGTGDTYGYQADGELTDFKQNATNPDTTPSAWSREIAYAYDPVGNRLSVTDSLAGTTSYGVDHANRYSSVTGANISHSDSRGNVTLWNEWTYAYDSENRMTSASKSGLTMTFAYDPAGRQVIRTTNRVAEYVVYCGAQQVQRVDANDSVQEYTIWGLAADELIAGYKREIGRIYYHGDIQGSTEAITDSSRTVLEYYRYDVYGSTICYDRTMTVRPTSAYNIRFLYTGQEYLASLGLYNYKARFYSPAIGRFLQIDPAGLSAGDINLYRYCHNNGVNGVDPTGMQEVNYGGFLKMNVGGSAAVTGTGQNEEKKAQPAVGIEPRYTKFSRMSFMQKYGRRNAPNSTASQSNVVGDVYAHGVFFGVAKHGSVRLYPDNPDAIDQTLTSNGFPKTKTDAAGNRYVVFSGGPEGGLLTGNINNRPSDFATATNTRIGEITAPAGVPRDNFITQLINNTATYNTHRLDYDLVPPIQNGYNSNSYFTGLVQSAGGTVNANLNWQFIGAGKPVPGSNF